MACVPRFGDARFHAWGYLFEVGPEVGWWEQSHLPRGAGTMVLFGGVLRTVAEGRREKAEALVDVDAPMRRITSARSSATWCPRP